jgi:alpha-glucosidase (family GH31 glycosyl hydrolase)
VIRHRPAGLGHPYREEPDQRVPVHPAAGEQIQLRATTPASLDELVAEVVLDGRERRLPAELASPEPMPDDRVPAGPSAATRRPPGRSRRAWVVHLPPQAAGTRIRYRFVAEGGWRTRWFIVVVAGWCDAGGTLVLNPADTGANRLVPGSVAWLVADRGPLRVRFALRLEAGAHVVGFGERFDSLDQRGRRLDAMVFEQYKDQGNRTYLPVPFAIVVPGDGRRAWGFHLRTGHRSWYDVGAEHRGRIAIEVALDPDVDGPTVAVSFYQGTPAEVLRGFLDETGVPVVPPDWVFRPWMSGNEWNTQARVRAQVERTLAEDIPAGVIVLEAWSDETTFAAFRDARYVVHPDGSPHRLADFTFPADGAWPDPKGLMDWLHGHDIRVLLWQVPLLKTRPAPTGQARADRDVFTARGYGVREAGGRPYRNRGRWFPDALLADWTNPEGRAWWLEKRRYLVEELGIDGFKTDGGEHAWGDDLRYADGSRGSETNNRYPVLYASAYQALMRSAGRPPVTFSRAGFTGAGTAPAHWAGDENSTWAAFRASITAGLTAGASGIFFWGWDLGGFSGEIPSAELYLRAAAMASLCPIMQYHSEFNHHRRPSRDRTPWNIAERTGDARVIAIYRQFAHTRQRLVPYLVEQARHAVERRVPLMRALFFDWPDDPRGWCHPYEYMLGDDLLVAPVVAPGVDQWEVYLPPGVWIDAWTGERVEGAQVVTREVPLDTIPLYRRVGAVNVPELVGSRT